MIMYFTIPLILSALSRFWSSYVPHHGSHGPANAPSNGHEAPRTGPLPIPGSSTDGRPCKSPRRPLDSYTATSLFSNDRWTTEPRVMSPLPTFLCLSVSHFQSKCKVQCLMNKELEFKPWQLFFLSFWFITLDGFCYLFVSFVCNMKHISCLF